MLVKINHMYENVYGYKKLNTIEIQLISWLSRNYKWSYKSLAI